MVEAKTVETRKGVGRETDTPREIETIETTREIEIEVVSVAGTATEIETGTVTETETDGTR